MKRVLIAAILTLGAMSLPQPRASGQAESVRMIADEGEGAKYWPRWRGPSGQGLAAGSGYPDTWSPTQNIVWKVPVPGAGNSSPIVWGDYLFVTSAYDGGRKLSLLAYRRSDGRMLWEASAPPGRTDSGAHPKNGHASSTPATDGRRIYVLFGARGLIAFDFTGNVVGQRDVGPMDAYHGAAGSPLLYRDRVILYQDQASGGFIAAFDSATGRQIWRTQRDANVGWGTPIAIRAGTRDEVIVNGQRYVIAYDPMTGRELWRCGGMTYEVIPTPVVGYGMVFCSSGRAGPTLAIRPGGTGDVSQTHLAWTNSRGSPFVPSPILHGEHIYMVNDMASVVTALDATSGRMVWQGRLGVAQREGFSASPVAADGKIFFTNDEGDTFVLRAGPTFDLIRVNRLGEPVLASPALVDGRWFFRTQRNLYAVGR